MKSWIKRVLNLLLWFSFSLMVGTGLLIAFHLPPGSRGGRGLRVLDWGRHDWGDLHLWVSYVFVGLVVIHLILSWKWLIKVAAKKKAWMILGGLAAGVAIPVVLLLLPVTRTDDDDHGPGFGQGRGPGWGSGAMEAGEPGQGRGRGPGRGAGRGAGRGDGKRRNQVE